MEAGGEQHPQLGEALSRLRALDAWRVILSLTSCQCPVSRMLGLRVPSTGFPRSPASPSALLCSGAWGRNEYSQTTEQTKAPSAPGCATLQDQHQATSVLCTGREDTGTWPRAGETQEMWLPFPPVPLICMSEMCRATLVCKTDGKQMLVPGNALRFVKSLILCAEELGQHPRHLPKQ